MVHEEYLELIAARALGALDEVEARALEAHLKSCPGCVTALDELEGVAALLSYAAPSQEPSPQVRARLLSKIESEKRSGADGREKSAPAQVVQMPTRPASHWSPLQRWGAIAAVLALVALGVSLFVVWRQNQQARQELARNSQQMQMLEQELTRLRDAQEIMISPGARLTALAGTEVAPTAKATIAFDQAGRAVLMTRSLPKPPPGMAYQLWFISGGKKMPGKVFKTNEAGVGALSDHIPNQALNSSVFAITLEPEGGMPQPTGAIYLVSGT